MNKPAAGTSRLIRAVPLTAKGFAPFGRILAPLPGRKPDADEAVFSFTSAALPRDLPDYAMIANLVCKPREFSVRKLERHTDTPEMLAALDGDSLLCVAPSSADPATCGPEGITAFRINRGQAVLLGPGTWHWIPFPLLDKPSLFLLMLRNETGENDLEIVDLREEYSIGL
jgi:ureidoglycolate hydrolase